MSTLTSAELSNGHLDQKEVPPPQSSSLSLPPARAQSQPTGFPSPPTSPLTMLIPPIGGSVPPLQPITHNGVPLHPSSSPIPSALSHPHPTSSSLHPSFSRTRLIAELQLGMRQVAGPAVSVVGPTSNGAPAGGEAKLDEDAVALQSAFSSFFALSPGVQAECLLFYLSDGALLGELVRYFLTPASGQAKDVICQWLYDVHWHAFHAQSPSPGVVITTAGTTSPPPASLFILHLVPVLVFSYLYRTQRGLPAPGVAAVLLGIYNVKRAQSGGAKGPPGRFIDPQQLASTVYGAPLLSLPSSPPGVGGGVARQQAMGPTLSPAALPRVVTTGTVPMAYPAMTELNASTIALLIHVVLSHYIAHLSAMSLYSQQQFAYLCAILSDNHCEGEIHRTLKDFAFPWGGDWEATLAGAGPGGRRHVKVKVVREEDEEEEEDNERNGPRYQLTAQLLQDLLIGLTYCACYPATKALSLLSLRAIHCRAVEELMPAVLLQTTAILESVEE